MAETNTHAVGNRLKNFAVKHKKKLYVGAGVCGAVLGTVVLSKIFGDEPRKYSGKWFDTVSDEVLSEEREIVRQKYCSSGDDFSLAVNLESLLRVFDSVMSKRAWAGREPQPPSYHREHGLNLYKPD